MATKNKRKQSAPTSDTKKQASSQPDRSRGDELMAWKVSPMQREPRKAKIFLASTLGFLGVVYVAYWDLLWVAIAALLIVGAFNSFIFPSRYRLTTLGIEQKAGLGDVFKSWSSFVRVTKFKDGIMLNHGKGKLRNRLNPGMFVYFGEDNSSNILRIVEQYISQESPPAV